MISFLTWFSYIQKTKQLPIVLYTLPQKKGNFNFQIVFVEMTFGPKFTDLHSYPKERQLQKSCVSFGEECTCIQRWGNEYINVNTPKNVNFWLILGPLYLVSLRMYCIDTLGVPESSHEGKFIFPCLLGPYPSRGALVFSTGSNGRIQFNDFCSGYLPLGMAINIQKVWVAYSGCSTHLKPGRTRASQTFSIVF